MTHILNLNWILIEWTLPQLTSSVGKDDWANTNQAKVVLTNSFVLLTLRKVERHQGNSDDSMSRTTRA